VRASSADRLVAIRNAAFVSFVRNIDPRYILFSILLH
jgi:hypothetical protein